MGEILLDALLDALSDCAKILPILYITYLLIEFIEKRASEKVDHALEKAGRAGPLFGGLFGLIPQCGFSSAAAGFYATRTITMGTLIAVFLATSDEMLPILISSQVQTKTILLILSIKLGCALIIGFLVDLFIHKPEHDHCEKHGDSCHHQEIHELCERAHCHCDEGQNIFLSALIHTAWIGGLIFAVTLALNVAFGAVGEDAFSQVFSNRHFLGEVIAAVIGLIPNCSSSVLITDLYVHDVIGIGPLVSGLLVNSGVGLLVLLRSNKKPKENLLIIGILLVSGILFGTLFGFIL